ncbi:hypothetical protein [Pseudomonas sp. Root562]|uniref:hypothetical protein n=1 Tax=Pseudomonas sp. Root562 TaxID=1736561 RepID=UPI000A66DD99|nr:hypothetical protein [Pseudomonas sp. Root562]
MRKVAKKSPTLKSSSSAKNRLAAVALTASQRQLLQLVVAGIEDEPDGVLAGESFRFSQ